jgi:opine dehydrogenase
VIEKNKKIAVLGAGNGGQAKAADLAHRGLSTNLWNRSQDRITPLQKQGGIHLEGLLTCFSKPALITSNLEAAISGIDIIMITTTAPAHRSLIRQFSPYLREGQMIILNPGRTGGALEVRNTLQEEQVMARIYVAEAQSLPYACRITKPGSVRIAGIKNELPLAALPADDTPYVLESVQGLFPSFTPARHVLETSLGNIGAIFHPAVALFNICRIEEKAEFLFYKSVTPKIAAFLDKLDLERLAIGKAFGLELTTASDWLTQTYDNIRGTTLHDRIQSNTAYAAISGPTNLKNRLLYEEVPTGLVPLIALGRIADIPTPLSSSLAILASALTGVNFHTEGRTLARMGITGLSAESLINKVLHKKRKPRPLQTGVRQIELNQTEIEVISPPEMVRTATAASSNPEALLE